MTKAIFVILFFASLPLFAETPTDTGNVYFKSPHSNRLYYRDSEGNFYTRKRSETKWERVKTRTVLSMTSGKVTEYEFDKTSGFFRTPDRVRITKDSNADGEDRYEFAYDVDVKTAQSTRYIDANPTYDEPLDWKVFPQTPGPNTNAGGSSSTNTVVASYYCGSDERTLVCHDNAVAVCLSQKAYNKLNKDGGKGLREADCALPPSTKQFLANYVATSKNRSPEACAKSFPCHIALGVRVDGKPKGSDLYDKINEQKRQAGVNSKRWQATWKSSGGRSPYDERASANTSASSGTPNPNVRTVFPIPQMPTVHADCNVTDNQFETPRDVKSKSHLPHCWKAVQCKSTLDGELEPFWMEAEEANTGRYSEATQGEVEKNCAGPVSLLAGDNRDQIAEKISKSNDACLSRFDWSVNEDVCPAGNNRKPLPDVQAENGRNNVSEPQETPKAACAPFPNKMYDTAEGCSRFLNNDCLPEIAGQIKSCKSVSGCSFEKCSKQYDSALKFLSGGSADWDIDKIKDLYKNGLIAQSANWVVRDIATLFQSNSPNVAKNLPTPTNPLVGKCIVQWTMKPGSLCTLKSPQTHLTLEQISKELNKFVTPKIYTDHNITKVDLKRIGQIKELVDAMVSNKKTLTIEGMPSDEDLNDDLKELTEDLSNLADTSDAAGGREGFFETLRQASEGHDSLPIIRFTSPTPKTDYTKLFQGLDKRLKNSCINRQGLNGFNGVKKLFTDDMATVKLLNTRLKECASSSGAPTQDSGSPAVVP